MLWEWESGDFFDADPVGSIMTGKVFTVEVALLQVMAQLGNRVGTEVLTVPIYVDLHFGDSLIRIPH